MQEQNSFILVIKKIWPTVYRVINGILFFIVLVIKGMVRIAIKEVKGQ